MAGPHWDVLEWDPDKNSLGDFELLAAQADVIIGGELPLQKWPNLPKLRLYQVPWTGYDFCAPEDFPAGVPVCNTFEHETAIAEYVLLGILEWQIGLSKMNKSFRSHGWGNRWDSQFPFHGEIRGKTIGIVGYGHIGEQIAERAKAFEMRVIGVRRRKGKCPDMLDWLGPPDRLEELLSESHFVVVACDLNQETRGMIDRKRLMRMRPDGVIINVARGEVIEEHALYDALSSRQIGGAIIDVWYNYDERSQTDFWPANYPFEKLDNVILSAHQSSWTKEQIERRWTFIAGNMKRAVTGEPLANLVFTGTQTGK